MTTKYDAIVVNFIQQKKGHFILVTEDILFEKTFRAMLKTLALDENHLTITTLDKLNQKIKKLLENGYYPIILLELFIAGNYNIEKITEIKQTFQNIKILCLSGEIDRDKVVYILEAGADNIIIKPVSINSLIQKIYFCVKKSNLTKMVDKAQKLIEEDKLEEAEELIKKNIRN